MNNTHTIGMSLEGLYKVAVVDAVTGTEIWSQPEWGKNLILNQGMNALAWYYPVDAVAYGIAGTGTRVNNLNAGESSGSSIGGWFSLLPLGSGLQDLNTTTYGGWIGGILDVGDLIKFNDGTEVTVTNVGDLSASIQQTTTIASQSFAIWKTSQTGLQSEVKRCFRTGITNASYYTGESGCITTTSSFNRIHHLRTFDFASESILKNYTEVGVGWDADNSPSQSTFSRILLPDSVTVSGSQRLRLRYQLNICYSPESASYMTNAPISGWPDSPATNTNLTQSFQLLSHPTLNNRYFYSWINASDGNSLTTSYPTIEPPSSGLECAFWLSTNSQSMVQLGATAPPSRTTSSFGASAITSSFLDDYVLGSYQRSKYATFSQRQMNYSTIRTMGFGNHVLSSCTADNTGQVFAVMFDQTQSKYDTQTLTLRYLWTWNRVLSS